MWSKHACQVQMYNVQILNVVINRLTIVCKVDLEAPTYTVPWILPLMVQALFADHVCMYCVQFYTSKDYTYIYM